MKPLTRTLLRRRTVVLAGALGMSALVLPPCTAAAQWSTTYEQFYLPGSFNWTFRRTYPAADRLFNAFDYGHAILYERLYNDPGADPARLEQKEYDFITKKLLVSPPRLPLEEAAIEIAYAKIAPEAKAMFDWAHLLHRQVYDVLASESMSEAEKDATIARLLSYYKSRPDLAFSSQPKNMELMEGQPYSLAFRRRYPKFNGLIWGYHWLQVGLYEPLMIGRTQEERQAGVAAAVTRFRQMLENAPEHMPRVMPMTAAIAPTFAKRYQEAAIIFDNLHAMHDVISDILASEGVPHAEKRRAILEAGRRYRDASSFLMPVAEWSTMGEMMGVANMGGPAVGVLTGWPTPTLERGVSMLDAMKQMHGSASMPGMSMDSSHAAMGHAPGPMGASGQRAHDMGSMSMPANDSAMAALHARMMRDPVIHARVMADTAMRRLMEEASDSSTGMAGHAMPGMSHGAMTNRAPAAAGTTTKRPTATGKRATKATTKARTSARKPAAKPAAKPSAKPSTQPKPADDMKNMPGMHH